jgi:hypothetical protein
MVVSVLEWPIISEADFRSPSSRFTGLSRKIMISGVFFVFISDLEFFQGLYLWLAKPSEKSKKQKGRIKNPA